MTPIVLDYIYTAVAIGYRSYKATLKLALNWVAL